MICLNFILFITACGSDSAASAETAEQSAQVDPESIPDRAPGSALSPEERELLARAKGRDWDALLPAELEEYLAPKKDTTSAIFLWDPNTGAASLKEFNEATEGLLELGVRVAIAVVDGGDRDVQKVDLREAQSVAPAFRISPKGDYEFIPGGLPADGTLIVSEAGKKGPVVFPKSVPIHAYKGLLTAQAPK